jgi:D-alanine--poly(phosphoribitol) ligase subunit 1
MNDPERTKKVFFHQDGQKYPSYRVGDLGFFEDGMLFYRGRIDFQIKFNGFRIELEEINFYLSKNPLVRYGVVAPKYNKDNKVQQLVAVVELAEGVKEKYSEKEITQQIRESLEKEVMPYMIPQRFVYKDKLPISQNGKVNIKQVIKEVNNA